MPKRTRPGAAPPAPPALDTYVKEANRLSVTSLPEGIVNTYRQRTPQSAALYERARRTLPGGETRAVLHFNPYPFFVQEGEGAILVDVDGNRYIDLLNNYTSLILGHRHPAVLAAVESQLARGTSFAAPDLLQVELGEHIKERVPSVDHIRFCNSGTEAGMLALRVARASTGRTLVAKMEGGFHGTHELLLLGAPGTLSLADGGAPRLSARPGGVPEALDGQITWMPFNDEAAAEQLFQRYGPQLAAVFVEPVQGSAGAIPARRGFLEKLRELCDRHGALLVFDEVITFRLSRGGAQSIYGIRPDLTTFGKFIGGAVGGIGAVGGRADVMAPFMADHPQTLQHSGTFNANPLVAAAGIATLRELTPEALDRMNRLGDQLRQRLQEALARQGVAGQVTGMGSLGNIHLLPQAEPISSYRDVLKGRRDAVGALHLALLNRGVNIAPRGMFALSTAITQEHVDQTAAAFEDALAELKPWLESHAPELLARA